MENIGDWEQKDLVNELMLGRELARQLQIHLNVPSSSPETCETLVHEIQASYEKALSMLNPTGSIAIGVSESPPSLSGSPRTEDSERELKDHDLRHASRKRKGMPRWTRQVRVSPGIGLEGPLDDGFSWRKYGQKDILGAKYPRGYYRCTERIVQGCLATKQVQLSNEDPTIFQITYRGRHTCTQAHMLPPSKPLQNQGPTNTVMEPQKPQENLQQQSQDLSSDFLSGLKVITDQVLDSSQQSVPPFYFPPASSVKAENQAFSPYVVDKSFIENSHFSLSSSGMHHYSFGGNRNFQTSAEAELTDIICAATSTTDTPTIGFDFPFANVEFDPNTFDNSGFLS